MLQSAICSETPFSKNLYHIETNRLSGHCKSIDKSFCDMNFYRKVSRNRNIRSSFCNDTECQVVYRHKNGFTDGKQKLPGCVR